MTAAALDLSLFSRPRAEGLLEMTLAVEGVACGGCIARIEGALKRLPGLTDARLNFTTRRLTVAWKPNDLDPAQVIRELDRLGYRAHPFHARSAEEEETRQFKWLLRCLAVAGFAAMNIMLLSVSIWSGNVSDITAETRDFFHWASALIALPAAAYAGQPFFLSAFAALRARSVNMDVPISLGVVLALGMSVVETATHAEHAYFDSAVMLLFFLLCGRALDVMMRRRTRSAAGNLAALRAQTAQRLSADGTPIEVPAAALRPGDMVLVRPGDRVPADGTVAAGRSDIDESVITGETAPRAVTAPSQVFAGSLNVGGALTLRVTAAGENSVIDDIERLLDRAVKAKSRYVRLADRAARAYAPMVHTAAAVTLAGWLIAGASAHDAIITAIAVLIITCPCALALAIPAVQVVAANRLFRAGILLNSGDAIERLAQVDTIVFDKTGTLTLPEPRVSNAASIDPKLLRQAARLAQSSRHPLAAAVARHADGAGPFDGAVEEPGRGVRAAPDGIEMRLGSAEFCALDDNDRIIGIGQDGASMLAFRSGGRTALLLVRQQLRPDACGVIAAARGAGFDIHILSGDRRNAVAPIAVALGIDRWQAGLKPADKVAALDALKAQGRRVLMVGDGLNDAPSLAAAHVSMSPITAADLTQAQADALFLGERLAPVMAALGIAQRAGALMRQNLWLAIAYNALAVPIAVAGLVTPLLAAAAMSGSSILVTLNALRLGVEARAPDNHAGRPGLSATPEIPHQT